MHNYTVVGLYPIGEGAGYAGGIMTACVDGVKAVEAFIHTITHPHTPPPSSTTHTHTPSSHAVYPPW